MPELKDVTDAKDETTTVVKEKTEVAADDGSKKSKKSKALTLGSKTKATNGVTEVTTIEKKSEKVEYRRPPLEQITTDLEAFLITLVVAGKPVTKLGYKCGKIIYGLHNTTGKDFRVIAYKARKKHKTVTGKSRCIYYFGMDLELPLPKSEMLGAQVSKFGKCSVQSKRPIEVVVDKMTFTNIYKKDAGMVLDLLKKLATLTAANKTKQYNELKKKKEAKEEA
jgi:hypothetical protein